MPYPQKMEIFAPNPDDVISHPVTILFRRYLVVSGDEEIIKISNGAFDELVIGYWPTLHKEKM